MDIVFSINQLGLDGLGATLTSLIRNCSDSKELKLWFLCSELREADKQNIRQLLQQESFQGQTAFVDFNAKKLFGHVRSLHGDWTTYGRLLIPHTIQNKFALYLDADLVILTDVLKLKNFESKVPLAAVASGTAQYSLENNFLINMLHFKPDTKFFNAGVLFFNIEKWKEDNVDEKIKELSAKYPNEFLSADQSLLNAYCEGKFDSLPKEFNVPWYPGSKRPENSHDAILHFVGSPKPWDMFGKVVHQAYDTWKEYNTPFWAKKYNRLTKDKLRRTWKIRRSLLKSLKNKLTKG